MLQTHHRTLQRDVPSLQFTFLAENVGTRPATDTLVTIEAHGGFLIKPPSSDDEDEDEDQKHENEIPSSFEARLLPRPPTAPRGRWRDTFVSPLRESLRNLDQIGRSLGALPGFARGDPDFMKGTLASPSLFRPHSRDPNAFYYKPTRPSTPQDSFALECAQWRHGDEAQPFEGEIHVPTDDDEVEGLLICRIQAANLCPGPFRAAFRFGSRYRASAHSRMPSTMVDTLIDHPEYRIGVSVRQSDISK